MQFNLFWTVFRAAAKDTLFSGSKFFKSNSAKKKNEQLSVNGKSNVIGKSLGKIGVGISVSIGIIALMFYLVFFVATTTLSAIQVNMHKELLFFLLALVQLTVLFFGSMTTLNFLYFSKDNQLLITLPIKNSTIFGVKFSLAYLSELLISVIMGLPLLITYGIVLGKYGMYIGANYYILALISLLILPIIPLLIISLLSIPLMYIASFLKKRVIGKTLVVAVITLFFMAVYFMLISGATTTGSNLDENGMPIMGSTVETLLKAGGKVGIVNFNLVQAMLGNKPVLNFAIYIGIIVTVFAIALIVSSLFYKKGISVALEENNFSKKAQNVSEEKKYGNATFRKSFFIKEIKTIFSTPSLFMNSIIGIVAVPLMFIFMGNSVFNFSEPGEAITLGTELGTIGFLCYMASIMMSGTNTLSLVGFSLEGKNISILKSLPLKPKDIVLGKILVSNIYNLIMAIIAGTTYIFVSDFHNVFVGLAIMVILFINGVAISAIGLNTDIKNPTFNYKNLNELTKNNKKTIKPMLISLAIGFSYMILGILFAIATDKGAINTALAYVIFFGLALLINGLFAFITLRKIFDNADDYFEKIEV